MNSRIIPSHRLLPALSLALGVLACPMSVPADEPEQTISDPGYRPESEYVAGFLDAAGTAKIAVLPTLVRRTGRTAHSYASQQQIVAFLNESQIATATAKPRRIDLGPLRRPSQWEIFEYGTDSIAEKLGDYETGADYALVMELLVPDDQAIFGIEVYIMDRQGRSAFSFLLNSHHEMFSDAKLFAKNSSEASRDKMIENATRVALIALKAQIAQARECSPASSEITSIEVEPGILHDFQSQLASGTSRLGISLGFSTISDGTSAVNLSRTGSHPALPKETAGNQVFQLSLDVTGWAGIVHLFPDEELDTWAPQDWRALNGFSFWLYGNNSAAQMFVDVLDNRSPCSRRDDAERYTYEFWDDVPGWRLISVPFKDMVRKEIGNGAPNDGLNLADVHGWGLGSLNTDGPRTYYIDDFQLWISRAEGDSKPLGVITHELFVETRLDKDTSIVVIEENRQKGLVVEQVMNLACAFAQITTDRGYRYYRTDERAKLAGGRASSRITFYNQLPDGIPFATRLLDEGNAEHSDIMLAAIDAVEFVKACELLKSQSQAQEKQ